MGEIPTAEKRKIGIKASMEEVYALLDKEKI